MKNFIDTSCNNIRKIFHQQVDIRRSDDHLAVIIPQISFHRLRAVQIFLQRLPQDGLNIDDRWNSNGQHRCSNGLLIDAIAMIPHAAAWLDPRIRQLDRRADPLNVPRCQRIDDDDHIRLHDLRRFFDHFSGLHAGGTGHAGNDAADVGHLLIAVRIEDQE